MGGPFQLIGREHGPGNDIEACKTSSKPVLAVEPEKYLFPLNLAGRRISEHLMRNSDFEKVVMC